MSLTPRRFHQAPAFRRWSERCYHHTASAVLTFRRLIRYGNVNHVWMRDMTQSSTAFDEILDLALNSLSQWARWGCRGWRCSQVALKTLESWGRPAAAAEPVQPRDTAETLALIRADLGECRRCGLSGGRTHLVFGEGNPHPDLVFVGEGPGFEEDQSGRPFVGPAGQLLTKIIEAMKLRREQVYICNVVKCRPPGNRNPTPEEIQNCRPFLDRQLAVLRPKVICALGTFAAQLLIGSGEPISRLRGRFHDVAGMKVMPTFHPAFLLRNPDQKRAVWEDVKKMMAFLGLTL